VIRRSRVKRATSALLVAAGLFAARDGRAYRPFDGTDADVAATGEVELEVGPTGVIAEGREHAYSPGFIFNYGLIHRVELVLEGHGRYVVDTGAEAPRLRFVDGGAFLKGVLREGVLQGKTGLSIATEIGPLLPETGSSRAGASAAVIVSDRSRAGTIHWNGAALYTHDHDFAAFLGAILEGPDDMVVRPVAEIFFSRTFSVDWMASALVGAIWTAGEDFSFDVGLRQAIAQGRDVSEVRLGFTWAFQALEF
jgi:hypothetical protein